jgi:hypothetical protein
MLEMVKYTLVQRGFLYDTHMKYKLYISRKLKFPLKYPGVPSSSFLNDFLIGEESVKQYKSETNF